MVGACQECREVQRHFSTVMSFHGMPMSISGMKISQHQMKDAMIQYVAFNVRNVSSRITKWLIWVNQSQFDQIRILRNTCMTTYMYGSRYYTFKIETIFIGCLTQSKYPSFFIQGIYRHLTGKVQETKCLETQVPNAFHIPTVFVLELYNLYFAEVHFPIATMSYEEATEQRGKKNLTLQPNAPPLDKLETCVFTKHQISFGLA